MNFLSHFYFDRYTTNPNQIIGGVLPDLIKNAKKDWNIHPEKKGNTFLQDEELSNILIGWKRHLEVDKHFHSSDFFIKHTNTIRAAIAPILEHSAARPSFVAHIALELMLDGLLLTESIIDANTFYQLLTRSSRESMQQFLLLNNLTDTAIFFKFLDEFIEASYLNSYREANNIMYALNRVCMRVLDDPFTDTQKLQLTAVLIDYQEKLKEEFMQIFDQIDQLLN